MRLPLDPDTGVLIHFDETEENQRPVDRTGNLAPLAVVSGLGLPTLAAGARDGHSAREWHADSPAQGFQAVEDVDNATRFTRDVTIEMIVNVAWELGPVDGSEFRLLTRGTSAGSAAETELYGLTIQTTGHVDVRIVELKLRWQEIGGANATVPSAQILSPDGWLYVVATRRWVSTTECVVAYYVNGAYIGGGTSTNGDIGDGIGGTMLVGCETAVGSSLLEGSMIDEIRVSPVVRSAEEIRWTYNYALVFGDYGYDLLRSLQPPGQARPQNSDSRFQQLFQAAGDALGVAWAKAAEMLDDFLPDRAWSFLDRWESVTRLAPLPSDSIETRRARVVGFLRRVQGFTRDQILEAVTLLLDAAVDDLSFVEVSNIWLDEFPGAALDPRWRNETVVGTVAVTGGHAALSIAAGQDVRWDAATMRPLMLRTTVPAEDQVEVACKLTSLTLGENGAAVGLWLGNRVTGEYHLFGIKRSAGANKWWYATLIGGVFTETLGATIAAGTSYWLRYVDRGGGTADVTYQVDGTTYDGPWTVLATIATPITGAREWCGLFMSDSVNPVVTGSSVNVESFRLYAPRSRIVFHWFIYRDPGVSGTPDLIGAQRVIDGMTPAHEAGHITTALVALYDDPDSTYDRTPLGA